MGVTTYLDPVAEKVEELGSMLRIASSDVIFCACANVEDVNFVSDLLKRDVRGIHFRDLHYKENLDLAEEVIKILKDSDFEIIEKYERRKGTVNSVISVFGLEKIFNSRYIERLNLYRDLFLRLNHPVLIWIAKDQVKRFALEAPDFWRIRTKVFYFEESEILYSKANTFQRMKRYGEALEYFKKGLQIHEDLNDRVGMAKDYDNIGLVLSDMSNYPQALEYFKKALEIDEELNDKVGMGRDYANIGLVLSSIGNYQQALDYHNKALEIHDDLNDRVGMGRDYANIGLGLKELNKRKEAEVSVERGLNILSELEKETGYHHPLMETLKEIKESLEDGSK